MGGGKFSQQRDLPRSVTHRYSLIIDSADLPAAVGRSGRGSGALWPGVKVRFEAGGISPDDERSHHAAVDNKLGSG